MAESNLAKELSKLIQLDIDAVHAYGQAIDKIDDPAVREQIVLFQGDHKEHIETLSKEVRALGETPPTSSPDFKGYLIEGFTAMRSITGTEGALKAMKSNEELTNKKYDKARAMDLPTSARTVIEKNYSDEQRHLSYIESTLKKF